MAEDHIQSGLLLGSCKQSDMLFGLSKVVQEHSCGTLLQIVAALPSTVLDASANDQ